MADTALATWEALNDRQQTYLRTLYDVDQAAEESHRRDGARGHWSNTPAREWRRIHFNDPGGPVVSRLRSAGVYESGAGSTLAVLERARLIELQHVPGLLGGELVYVWITPAGRKAVRAHHGGAPARATKPKWAVAEWLWRELVKVAAAGPTGLPSTELFGTAHLYVVEGYPQRGNRPYLASVQSFVRYEMRNWNLEPYNPPAFSSRSVYHYRFTEAGEAHYREQLEAYRELYPDVQAPELAPVAPSVDTVEAE